MGVQYEHFLIPRPNSFRPSAEVVIRLLDTLGKARWIRTPESRHFERMETDNMPPAALRTGAQYRHGNDLQAKSLPWPMRAEWLNARIHNDLRLIWPVGSLARSGLRYPLTR